MVKEAEEERKHADGWLSTSLVLRRKMQTGAEDGGDKVG